MDRLILLFEDKGDMASSLAIVYERGKIASTLESSFLLLCGRVWSSQHGKPLQASLRRQST